MKKMLMCALTLLMGLSAVSCAASPTPSTSPGTSAGQTELTVFAAASLTETLQQIQPMYAKVAPNVSLTFDFDSSGTLKTQIQQGADVDVFISAAQLQMDQLDITAPSSVNTDKLDFVNSSTRVNLLSNRVALVVPKGNPKNITSFQDLADHLQKGDILMAMGNSDVPVGQYTQNILKYFNLNEQQLATAGEITYGSNVKEVTTQVSEASVDVGVVYATDAFSAGLDIVDYATTDMAGQVIYPAAVMKKSKNPDAAAAFLKYLATDEAMTVFKSVGFSAPQ